MGNITVNTYNGQIGNPLGNVQILLFKDGVYRWGAHTSGNGTYTWTGEETGHNYYVKCIYLGFEDIVTPELQLVYPPGILIFDVIMNQAYPDRPIKPIMPDEPGNPGRTITGIINIRSLFTSGKFILGKIYQINYDTPIYYDDRPWDVWDYGSASPGFDTVDSPIIHYKTGKLRNEDIYVAVPDFTDWTTAYEILDVPVLPPKNKEDFFTNVINFLLDIWWIILLLIFMGLVLYVA